MRRNFRHDVFDGNLTHGIDVRLSRAERDRLVDALQALKFPTYFVRSVQYMSDIEESSYDYKLNFTTEADAWASARALAETRIGSRFNFPHEIVIKHGAYTTVFTVQMRT